MKILLKVTIITFFFSFFCYDLFAQTKELKKHTWRFTGIPTISYNTDIGLQVGAVGDLYDFGDGSIFPEYKHKFTLDIAYATKGSAYLYLYYDSKYLIPKTRFTALSTYMVSSMFPFMGFNGIESPFRKELDLNKSSGTAFYNVHRQQYRLLLDFQGDIFKQIKWSAGLTFWYYCFKDIENKHYSSTNTLYRKYIENGIISPNEAKGGSHLEFKLGLSFDDRDFEPEPSKGMCIETFFYASPDMFQKNYHYLKFAAHLRQYISLWKKNIVFAYHLAYQTTVIGNAPFYIQSTIPAAKLETEGLGGKSSLRGILFNRIVADAYAWANVEFRFLVYSFNLFKQHCRISINPLFDLGLVTKRFRHEELKKTSNPLLYSDKKDIVHASGGCGIKFSLNYNFILSLEVARAFDRQDSGNQTGLSIGMNYVF